MSVKINNYTCAICNPEISDPDVDWCPSCQGENEIANDELAEEEPEG